MTCTASARLAGWTWCAGRAEESATWARKVNLTSCTRRSRSSPTSTCAASNGTSTAASPGSESVSSGAPGTSRTGGYLPPGTDPTCLVSTPTFKPPSADRSSPNSSPTSPSPTIGSKQHSQVSEQLLCADREGQPADAVFPAQSPAVEAG